MKEHRKTKFDINSTEKEEFYKDLKDGFYRINESLYKIMNKSLNHSVKLPELADYIVKVTPEVFQKPELIQCQLSVFDKVFKSRDFKNKGKIDNYPITVFNKIIGEFTIELKPSDQIAKNLDFSKYESEFLSSTADIVGLFIERLEKERKLKEERNLFSILFSNIGDGIISLDKNGGVVLLNLSAEGLLGINQTYAIGKKIWDIIEFESGSLKYLFRQVINKEMNLARARTGMKNSSGNETEIEYFFRNIYDKSNRIIGTILIIRDITERLKLEENMMNAQRLESVSLLAGGIAHDFNNFLTAIMLNVSLAKMTVEKGSKAYTVLSEAEHAANRAKSLTHQLLTFSKGSKPIKEKTDIMKIVREAVEFSLSGSNVKSIFKLDSDSIYIAEVDCDQITQVINNLIINAKDAMPGGGEIEIGFSNISLVIDNTYSLPPGEYIKLTISDKGSGIRKEYLERIFDPYFTTKKHGTGIGLATSFSIIKKHGGIITAESEPGKGTTFTILIPGLDLSKEPAKEARLKKETITGHSNQYRILVMDDEENILNSTRRLLEHLGYFVDTATEGETVIEKYLDSYNMGDPFHLLLMDLTIPGGMGGEETIRKLLQINPDIKVIVASGYSNNPVMAEFEKYGFTAGINKPYDIKELNQLILKVVENDEK